MKIHDHIARIIPKASLMLMATLFAFITSISPTYAHKSPANCTGSSLGIVLYVDSPNAHIGDTISYSVLVFNSASSGGFVNCDASGITATMTTPDGQIHPITLVRTALSGGQSDSYIVTYIARAIDIKPGGVLTATANDTGTIHQNDTNSQGGGNQGLNVTVISVSPSISPTTSPTPLPPTTTPTPPPVPGSGGGTHYGCIDPKALNYEYFASSNPELCLYSSTTTPPMIVPATTTTITATIVSPTFPNTGFPPEETNDRWDTITFAGIFDKISQYTSEIFYALKCAML